MWNIAPGAKNQAFLQQTCVFNSEDELSSSDVDDLLLSHVVWNSTGKLLAAAVDNLINIWQLNGMVLLLLGGRHRLDPVTASTDAETDFSCSSSISTAAIAVAVVVRDAIL